jgi:O-succinylbenzoate synthase
MAIVVTTLLESAVGRAAALHLAASLGETAYAHGVATGGALERDIADGLLPLAGGTMPVPEGPGLGITLPEEFWNNAYVEEES